MTWKSLFVATLVLVPAAALAQPGAPGDETPPPGDMPPPAAEEPPPAPPHPPQPTVAPMTVRTIEADGTQPSEHPVALIRPEGFSVGIGVGYRFPTALSTPNASSVRFRLAGGFTFEPNVVFATTSHSMDMGMAATQKATELGIGALGRIPLMARRRTDLELLAGVDVDNLSIDPDDQNTDDVESITTITLRYGLAVGAWITPHLQASVSATNGLVTFTKNRQEQGIDTVTVTTDTTFGLIFDPTVVFMLHLYN